MGDRITLRGRSKSGVIVKMNDLTGWVRVDWDEDGPLLCHINELEKERA